jgi:hypothetical protein
VCLAYKNICVHIRLVTATCVFSHVFHTFREDVLFYTAFSRFPMNTCCPSEESSAIVLTFYVVLLYFVDPIMYGVFHHQMYVELSIIDLGCFFLCWSLFL